MSGFFRTALVGFLVAGLAISSHGQAKSPFTTYGLGDTYTPALISNQGMAGVGVAQPQYWFLNNLNPALLVYNNLTVFHAGIFSDTRTLKSDSLKERRTAGNMNYLATGFPVLPGRWHTSIGLMPLTYVNFEFAYADYVFDQVGTKIDTFAVREAGSGGLSTVYWSNGVRLSPDFSIGLKAAYLFGSISNTYSNQLVVQDQLYITTINLEEKTVVRDFQFTGGFSFSKDSLGRRQDKRLSLGATYTLATDVSARRDDYIFRTNTTGTDTLESITIDNQPGTISLPASFTVGVSWSKGLKWAIGAEYTMTDYANFRSVNADDENLTRQWKAALGMEFTPDPAANEKLLKRTTYRTGVSIEKLPFSANGNEVKDFGINFGFSFPAGRSSLDVAVRAGKRGDRKLNLLEENYFKIFFGITFNDQWFIKRKFD